MSDTRTEVEFHNRVEQVYIPLLRRLILHKGVQYAPDKKAALNNFYEGAELAKDTPEHYLMVQATKQWYVLSDWAKTESGTARHVAVSRREITQRLLDIVVYMFLLLFMIEAGGEAVSTERETGDGA